MTDKKLRVCHYPQIPCKPFIVEVDTLQEAHKIMNILADYDIFQYENKIKPDYCNVTILEQFDEESGEWESWWIEDEVVGYYDDVSDYLLDLDELK